MSPTWTKKKKKKKFHSSETCRVNTVNFRGDQHSPESTTDPATWTPTRWAFVRSIRPSGPLRSDPGRLGPRRAPRGPHRGCTWPNNRWPPTWTPRWPTRTWTVSGRAVGRPSWKTCYSAGSAVTVAFVWFIGCRDDGRARTSLIRRCRSRVRDPIRT